MSRARTPRTKPETKTPWFPIALACLFIVGCAADTKRRNAIPSPTTPRRKSLSFQVEGDSELYTPSLAAAETWSKALGIPITVTPDGDIPIILVETLDPGCYAAGALPTARGCSYVSDQPEDGWTEISSAIHPSVRYGVVLHEMGHHLRGTTGHLDGVPHAVMAEKRGLSDTTLLPEDLTFVCQGARVACPALGIF